MRVSFNQFSANLNSVKQNSNQTKKNLVPNHISRNSQNELISSNGASAIRSLVMSGVSFKGQEVDSDESLREEECIEGGVKHLLMTDKNGDLVQKMYYASDNETVTRIDDYMKNTETRFYEDGKTILSVNDKNLGAEVHYKKDGETISYINDFENKKVIYFKPDGMMIDHEVDYNGKVNLPY